jgi:hypothetical protein
MERYRIFLREKKTKEAQLQANFFFVLKTAWNYGCAQSNERVLGKS